MKSSNALPRLQRFTVFCMACFLLSISYGTTFLLLVRVEALGAVSVMQGRCSRSRW